MRAAAARASAHVKYLDRADQARRACAGDAGCVGQCSWRKQNNDVATR